MTTVGRSRRRSRGHRPLTARTSIGLPLSGHPGGGSTQMNEVPVSPQHRSRRRAALIIGGACAVVLAAAVAVLPGLANAAVSTNYQQNWSNGQGSTSFSPNRGNGSYSIRWNNVGDFVAG